MSMSGKVFDAISIVIKMSDVVKHTAQDLKELAVEVREIDKRVVRLETFVEIAQKQQKSIKDRHEEHNLL